MTQYASPGVPLDAPVRVCPCVLVLVCEVTTLDNITMNSADRQTDRQGDIHLHRRSDRHSILKANARYGVNDIN